MANYENLNQAELQTKLKEMKELFDEVTEERMIILGQRNIHLSSKLVTKYKNELDEILENIKHIEILLEEKSHDTP
jgi:archaellum component FlaC